MDFQKLLDASNDAVDLDKAFEETNKKESGQIDERFWKLTQKDNSGKATIRFMPNFDGKFPFVKFYSRFIKHEGKYYINKSLSTLGKEHKDPSDEFYFAAWGKWEETKDEFYQKLYRKLKRRERYLSLIYVVNDPSDTGEVINSGTVNLFEYGPEIFNITDEARKKENEFGPKSWVNPFSLNSDGANFGLLMVPNGDGNSEFGTYEKSQFLEKEALFCGDKDALKNMFEMNKDRFYDIHGEVQPDQFKSYDELEKELVNVFGDLYYDVTDKKRPNADGSVARQSSVREQVQKEVELDRMDDELESGQSIEEMMDAREGKGVSDAAMTDVGVDDDMDSYLSDFLKDD